MEGNRAARLSADVMISCKRWRMGAKELRASAEDGVLTVKCQGVCVRNCDRYLPICTATWVCACGFPASTEIGTFL